jgi:hypothetical protein
MVKTLTSAKLYIFTYNKEIVFTRKTNTILEWNFKQLLSYLCLYIEPYSSK